jgi:hypothetical protein
VTGGDRLGQFDRKRPSARAIDKRRYNVLQSCIFAGIFGLNLMGRFIDIQIPPIAFGAFDPFEDCLSQGLTNMETHESLLFTGDQSYAESKIPQFRNT